MKLLRLLRCTLPVLLLWPILSSALLLTVGQPRLRASVTRGMSCCSSSCGDCGSCEMDRAQSACMREGAPSGSCELTATPCHRPSQQKGTAFAWDPFMIAGVLPGFDPPLDGRRAIDCAQRAAFRAPDSLERPPAA